MTQDNNRLIVDIYFYVVGVLTTNGANVFTKVKIIWQTVN